LDVIAATDLIGSKLSEVQQHSGGMLVKSFDSPPTKARYCSKSTDAVRLNLCLNIQFQNRFIYFNAVQFIQQDADEVDAGSNQSGFTLSMAQAVVCVTMNVHFFDEGQPNLQHDIEYSPKCDSPLLDSAGELLNNVPQDRHIPQRFCEDPDIDSMSEVEALDYDIRCFDLEIIKVRSSKPLLA